jgi:hypothetical protein
MERHHRQERVMFKIAALVWMMAGTVFAGVVIMTILTVPSLSNQDMRLIPVGAVAGFILAIPVAFVVAKRMSPTARG